MISKDMLLMRDIIGEDRPGTSDKKSTSSSLRAKLRIILETSMIYPMQ